MDWRKMEVGKEGFPKFQQTCINNCSWTSTIIQLFIEGLGKFQKNIIDSPWIGVRWKLAKTVFENLNKPAPCETKCTVT